MITFQNIKKSFGDNPVLQGINLSFNPGEVHALLGENGAGKSTLVKIAAGLETPDSGSVFWGTQKVEHFSSLRALKAGVALVQQNPPSSLDLYLWEHALLGQDLFSSYRPGFLPLNPQGCIQRLDQTCRQWGWELPWNLSCGKADSLMLRKATVAAYLQLDLNTLIFDEPTTSLSPEETQLFLSLMTQLSQGLGVRQKKKMAVVLISHSLQEVMEVSQRVSILQKGQVIFSGLTSETNQENLRKLIFPETAAFTQETPVSNSKAQTPLMELKDFSLHQSGGLVLNRISLQLFPGQILGLAALAGGGLKALESLLSGLGPENTSGFSFMGQTSSSWNIQKLRDLGLAYVPSDRLGRGSSPLSPVWSNLVPHRIKDLSTNGVVKKKKIQAFFTFLQNRFGFKGRSNQSLNTLSGGNIQKVILARELENNPRVILLAEPSWGLDWAARAELFAALRHEAHRGVGVIILSSQIDDLLDVCTHIGVLSEGALVQMKPRPQWSQEELARDLLSRTHGGEPV